MGRENAILALDHERLPDTPAALCLLREIAGREIKHGPRRVDKPLVLYGAGNLGRLAASYFQHIGVNIDCVVDTNAPSLGDDPCWQGTPVFAPEEVPEGIRASSLLAVCISTARIVPIYHALLNQGWRDIVPFYDIAEAYRDIHPLGNGWFAGKLQAATISGVARVLAGWKDDVSRAHHLQFLAWRVLREEWTFAGAPVAVDDRYFIDPVRCLLGVQECLLDVGAHHGEVSVRFAQLVGGNFLGIYAVEPDPANLLKLRQEFARHFGAPLQDKVKILELVLGDRRSINKVYDGIDYATQLCSFGNRMVTVDTIDDLGLTPTFVKLHVEGSELDTFVGGLETIRQSRPIVAATIYHNELGIYRFPLVLMSCLEDYDYYLRLHGWCGTGLVMYALPKRRPSKTTGQKDR